VSILLRVYACARDVREEQCARRKQPHFFRTSHTFFRIPCGLFGPLLDGPLQLFLFGAQSELSPVSFTISTASDFAFSTLPKNFALSTCAGPSCISGVHPLCPSSSIHSIVRAWLSVPVLSALLRPSDLAIRLRRELIFAEELGPDDLKADDPGRRLLSRRHFRYMCHIIGRLVQRMPPRGSKAEYAPRGT
jgi:hypothetical protein